MRYIDVDSVLPRLYGWASMFHIWGISLIELDIVRLRTTYSKTSTSLFHPLLSMLLVNLSHGFSNLNVEISPHPRVTGSTSIRYPRVACKGFCLFICEVKRLASLFYFGAMIDNLEMSE